MTDVQKTTLQEVKDSEINATYIDLDDAQVEALKATDSWQDRHQMAKSSFASVLRGKVQGKIDKAIKAKYLADTKNKPALSAECEKEIQMFIKMKRSLE